jgi:hypothetical protein
MMVFLLWTSYFILQKMGGKGKLPRTLPKVVKEANKDLRLPKTWPRAWEVRKY